MRAAALRLIVLPLSAFVNGFLAEAFLAEGLRMDGL
jgi:hypothetical protein